MEADFTFATPLAARTGLPQLSPWLGQDKENMGLPMLEGMSPFPAGLDLDKAYEDWTVKMEKIEKSNSPILQTATKKLAELHKGSTEGKGDKHAGDAMFNRWITATEQLVFTPKTDLTSMRTPLCEEGNVNPPTPPADIMALKGHPLSAERTGVVPHVGAIGAGWYVRSPMPACVVERHAGQRQPEFDSDSDDETPSPSHSGMDDEEDEGDYDEGCDVEDASFGYASTQRTLTDQPDAVSDMAVSQLGATMSQLKVYAGPADGMEMSPAPSALLHMAAHMHFTPTTPKSPVDEVIDLMVHQPAPAIPDLQPQLLDFGAAVAAGGDAQLLAPAQAQQEQVPELQQQQQQQGSNDNAAGGVGHGNVMGFGGFGVDAVQYQQYAGDEESSDDEVDVASLGFTPLSLSTAPMSPISDVIALMMSPGEIEPLD